MLSLLHTVPGNEGLFSRLLGDVAPGVEVRHTVRADLLEQGMRLGAGDPGVIDAVRDAVRGAARGADVVLCTCSTIGGIAEATVPDGDVPVLRVDRAMAREAVRAGSRIVVAAAVQSTLEPTRALIEDESRRQGRPVEIDLQVVEGAWDALQSGGDDAYHDAIARGLRIIATGGVAGGPDVIVLAQATMAGAAERCRDLPVPVLSSPRLGLGDALARLGSLSDGRGDSAP